VHKPQACFFVVRVFFFEVGNQFIGTTGEPHKYRFGGDSVRFPELLKNALGNFFEFFLKKLLTSEIR
jgi:hypothetical protein